MKKTLLTLLLTMTTLFAAMTKEYVTPAFVAKNIKTFDIRTKGEWKQTGILKNSIPLTFFNEKGDYDVQAFIKELYTHIKPGEQFALICATGNRTNVVSTFLGKNNFNVIDLKNGIMGAMKSGMKLTPYTP